MHILHATTAIHKERWDQAYMCESSTSGYCSPILVTTSLQSMDTSRTLDFSTEHRRFCRFWAS